MFVSQKKKQKTKKLYYGNPKHMLSTPLIGALVIE
jgi:hypothetical protein